MTQIKKGLINGIYFDTFGWQQTAHAFHYPPAHVTVQIIVGGESSYFVFFYQRAGFEIRLTHGNAELFGFITAGDDTSVIVAQYHNRLLVEPWPEESLTSAVKTITIYNGTHLYSMNGINDNSPHR
jgi:hypothetical protein